MDLSIHRVTQIYRDDHCLKNTNVTKLVFVTDDGEMLTINFFYDTATIPITQVGDAWREASNDVIRANLAKGK